MFHRVIQEIKVARFLSRHDVLAAHYITVSPSALLITTVISKAHSFPQNILPNSMGQVAKFCGLRRENCRSSAAHRDLPFVSKLSYFLFRNFSYWKVGLVLCYVSNTQR